MTTELVTPAPRGGHDSTTTLLGVPIYGRHSPNIFVDKILKHNSYSQYSGCLLIGHSGSGKTTTMNMLTHLLHQKRNFAIHSFTARDLVDADKIIERMPRAPSILRFDDASYSLAEMTDTERSKLASSLTTIRHKVKNPVIVFLNIHYSKALEKFFRDTDFKILTSISDEEQDNFLKLFGYANKYKLYEFSKLYRAMLLYGVFRLGKYQYSTQHPFRVALVSELGKLHAMMYYKTACNYCVEDYRENTRDPQEIVNALVKSYGKQKARTVLRWWLYFCQGMTNALDRDHKRLFENLAEICYESKVDWDAMLELINTQLRHERQSGFEKGVLTVHERMNDDTNAESADAAIVEDSESDAAAKKGKRYLRKLEEEKLDKILELKPERYLLTPDEVSIQDQVAQQDEERITAKLQEMDFDLQGEVNILIHPDSVHLPEADAETTQEVQNVSDTEDVSNTADAGNVQPEPAVIDAEIAEEKAQQPSEQEHLEDKAPEVITNSGESEIIEEPVLPEPEVKEEKKEEAKKKRIVTHTRLDGSTYEVEWD